jgi:hypothetical protein
VGDVPRSDEQLRRTGWAVWGAQLAVVVVAGFGEAAFTGADAGTVVGDMFFLLISFGFSTVGALVLRRQPSNRLAWFMILGTGSSVAVPYLISIYASLGVEHGHVRLPGAGVAAAFSQGSWVLAIGTIGIYLLLLFPDGRLPTPRWRWLAWAAGVDIAVVAVIITLLPGKITEGPGAGVVNPLGIHALEVPLLVVFFVALACLPLLIVAAAVAMVRRFRRSQGTERLQMKWFAAAAAFVAASYLAAMLGQLGKPTPFDGPDPTWLLVLQTLASCSFVALPLAIAVAILRHRLYDIDVVIKRTVVYGSLSLTLVVVYLAVVLTLRSLTDRVTGDSQLAVAVSTLVVAALFRPLRRRIQAGVDHRFFRRAYDAALTLESFGDRLRQEVDLEAVAGDLRGVVDQTLQPAHLSLWLRAPAGRS